MQVWKYPIVEPADHVVFEMPKNAWPLCVHIQHGVPCIWVAVDPTAELEKRTFLIVGTGHEFGDDVFGYIGSFQLANGLLVFHVFDTLGGEQ